MNAFHWLEKNGPLLIAAGVPTVFYPFDIIVRDGFGLGVRDAGPDLALLAVAGAATLAVIADVTFKFRARRRLAAAIRPSDVNDSGQTIQPVDQTYVGRISATAARQPKSRR